MMIRYPVVNPLYEGSHDYHDFNFVISLTSVEIKIWHSLCNEELYAKPANFIYISISLHNIHLADFE